MSYNFNMRQKYQNFTFTTVRSCMLFFWVKEKAISLKMADDPNEPIVEPIVSPNEIPPDGEFPEAQCRTLGAVN